MRIKIIPNILSREGRSEFIPEWKQKKTVSAYLRERKIATKGMRVIVSGKALKKLSVTVKDSDEIIVTPKLEDPISAIVFSIGAAALAAAGASIATVSALALVTGWLIVGAVVGIATLAIMSAFSGPRKPSYGSTAASGGIDANSPTYGWDGVQTTQNVGTPIGIVYGEHKVGGNIINQFITNDGDKNYLHTLIALSEGEIESVAEIKVNDNPIANFEGIETAYVLGTNAQSPITTPSASP
jgi:predicted phage tail protein